MARGAATLGHALEPPLKKGRVEAANVIVQFQSDTGETVGAWPEKGATCKDSLAEL